MGPAMEVAKELTGMPSFETPDFSELFAEEKSVIKNLKKAILMVAGKAVQTFNQNINDEQEILMNLADMVIAVYTAESTLLRTEKLVGVRGEAACQNQIDITRVCLFEAVEGLNRAGKEAIAAFTTGDEQRVMLMGLKRFTKAPVVNTKALRRSIADAVIENNGYAF